ncbi:MAG: hypothetical protein JNL98_10070 [Bryobacterales bacterium]|nr:hypothetical protein [Bryobacterales bacterium]
MLFEAVRECLEVRGLEDFDASKLPLRVAHGEHELFLLSGGGLEAPKEVVTPLAVEFSGLVREDGGL